MYSRFIFKTIESACTGACLSEKRTGDDPDTPVTHQRRVLRWMPLQVPPAAPGPPPESLSRTRGVSPPPVHLLHECTINLMDAK
jgi:hypothetical protein